MILSFTPVIQNPLSRLKSIYTMEIKRLALVLVDISGYTRFMKTHTMSLLHAEAIITDRLEGEEYLNQRRELIKRIWE